MPEAQRFLCRAEVVYNGLGTPRLGAAVLVEAVGEGASIAAIDDAGSLQRAYPEAVEVDAGFAIAPPPVNAHTHFDLSGMPLQSGHYVDFVRAVIAHGRGGRRDRTDAEAGIEASLAAGVRVVGDVATTEEGMRLLLERDGLQGVAYWEVIGPDPQDADRIFDQTVEKLRTYRSWERPGGVRVGISPHAAHTVSAPLLRRIAALAEANDLPLQIHLAESPAEAELFHRGRGPLAELLGAAGASFRSPGVSPVQYLADLGVLAVRPTLVHMVEVDDADVRSVQHAGCAVVHCPRSNRALGCRRFPWELYAKHAATVAFGTDSLGSSPSLSPLEEIAAARELHGGRASPVALVRAAVKGGHRALGRTPPVVRRGAPAGRLSVWRDADAVPLDAYVARRVP